MRTRARPATLERASLSLIARARRSTRTQAESESLRIFYTTLYEQRPDSEIAPVWLMQHGLLPEEEAAALFKKVGAAKAKARTAGSASPSRASTAGTKRVRKADPRQGKGKAVAAANGGADAKAAAPPRKRPAKKAAGKQAVIIDDDDDDDEGDDEDFASKPPTKKAATGGSRATKPGAKFVGKSAIVDDDDSD